ncbi:hypothetical protein MSAN_01660000 [Mycena sanguinolenta]|uniref:Uncharacterized protein n=1 Tax=Mycena sanguinolenta TaxID=230812 RepID=A0A8H6Y0F9_9AGAR|nr:hypothetical protein MSAN_01660000 [Mycena sanguinolenta]
MDYYQLGGFNAAVYSYKGKNLGKTVYHRLLARQNSNADQPLELVLGIKKSGTTHILLTSSEKNSLRSLHDVRLWDSPSPASDFESLSPILFDNVQELEAKLASLQPKPKSTYDTSQLNKAYQGMHSFGNQRSQFENARMFYRVLQNPRIDQRERKFQLEDRSWSSVRVISFCFNVWLCDTRSPQDRRNSPRILDIAWCEASTPTLENDQMLSCRHIVFKNNQNLRNPIKKPNKQVADGSKPEQEDEEQIERTRYEYGETEFYEPQIVTEKIQEEFGRFNTDGPVVLLVHNFRNPESDTQQIGVTATDVFRSLGIDMTHWDLSLRNLLRNPGATPRQATDARGPRFSSRDPRRPAAESRRRSASPHRGAERGRMQSSPPPRRYPPVYVVDVQSMYHSVFGTRDGSDSVPAMLDRMPEIKEMFMPQGWCAGNECQMLLEVFREMARRGAIDEQKDEWIQTPILIPPVSQNPAGYEEESDYGSDSD